ncbi:MAG TPA: hypothetical protein VGF99_18245 [Myxococcota bacterium]
MRALSSLLVIAACSASCTSTSTPVGPPTTSTLTGTNFRVDVIGGPCAVGRACDVRYVVHALGATHINTEYPHRFEPAPTSAVRFDELKAFAVDDEHTGTLRTTLSTTTVNNDVAGNLRFSICSAEHCQIETLPVSLALPAS